MIAHMPFAHADGGVVLGLQRFRYCGLLGVQSLFVGGEQNAEVSVVYVHVDASRITPREQTGSRWRAHAAGGVETRQAHPLRRHAIDIGSLDLLGAKASEIGIAEVVAENDHEIGRPALGAYHDRQQPSETE